MNTEVIVGTLALIGVIGTAVASTIALFINASKDKEIARLTRDLDLRIEYDKDLRTHRIEEYQKMWRLLDPLAKYPKPETLTYERLLLLTTALRRWYFAGGGLFLSNHTRERYFDLQDGLRIVLEKRENAWPKGMDTKGDEDDRYVPGVRRLPGTEQRQERAYLELLKAHLDRGKDENGREREPSPLVAAIARFPQRMAEDRLEAEVSARLRALGSALRTSMTEDVLTRRGAYLREDALMKRSDEDRSGAGS